MDAAEEIPTYAVGDVHGRIDLLEPLLDAIRADADSRGFLSPRLVMLGDYVDRGPSSREVVELMIGGPEGFDLVCLKGNHDDLMVRAYGGDPKAMRVWLPQGGVATLSSYGWKPGMPAVLSRYIPKEHIEFLAGLPLSSDDGTRFFVHAGIDPGLPLASQTARDMMWIREPFLQFEGPLPRLVVHGHTPNREGPEVKGNRIGLDTYAYKTGILTCAAFDPGSREPRFIQAVRDDIFDTGATRIYFEEASQSLETPECLSISPRR